MTNILTPAEAANFVRTASDDAVMLMLLPIVDRMIEKATGRNWANDTAINDVAKGAAGMFLVLLYDNPAQEGVSDLPFALKNALGQLEAEALKYRKYQFYGATGAGSIAIPGLFVGDDVIGLVGIYGVSGSQAASFESEISVDGAIRQTSSSNLSSNLYVVVVKSPGDDVSA